MREKRQDGLIRRGRGRFGGLGVPATLVGIRARYHTRADEPIVSTREGGVGGRGR